MKLQEDIFHVYPISLFKACDPRGFASRVTVKSNYLNKRSRVILGDVKIQCIVDVYAFHMFGCSPASSLLARHYC